MKLRRLGVPALGVMCLGGLWIVRAGSASGEGARDYTGSALIEGTEVQVSSKTQGRIASISVQKGDSVKQGQVIAELDCEDQQADLKRAEARIAGTKARITAAKSALAAAQNGVVASGVQVAASRTQERMVAIESDQALREHSRAEKLHEKSGISVVEFENAGDRRKGVEEQLGLAGLNVRSSRLRAEGATMVVAGAQAELEAARATLLESEADQERASLAVKECSVVAPQAGTISARYYEPGSYLKPGTPLFAVLDMQIAKVTFYLPNQLLAMARVGGVARLRVDAYPGRTFEGTIRRVASEAEFTPRNVQTREDRDRLVFEVELHVDNQDGSLRAGMPGDVELRAVAP